MRNDSATQRIKHYLHYHRVIVFQVEDFHKKLFSDINYDSFRKFLSRLAKEGDITV